MDINRFRQSKIGRNQTRDYWDWWLSDELPTASVREEIRRTRVRQANAYQPRISAESITQPAATGEALLGDVKSVVINLRLPKITGLRTKRFIGPFAGARRKRNSTVILGVIVLVVLIMFTNTSPAPAPKSQPLAPLGTTTEGGTTITSMLSDKKFSTPVVTPNSVANPNASVLSARTSPTFIPVVPLSEPQLAKGQFARTNYDGQSGIYTFIDSLGDKPVTVNEKAGGPASLAQIAASIGATQTIALTGGAKAYVQPSGSGTQSAIFELRGVIVVINSQQAHSSDDWMNYVQTYA